MLEEVPDRSSLCEDASVGDEPLASHPTQP